MKIVIDIPRKTYEHIRADGGHGYFNIYDEDNRIVTKAVFNGKKLPEYHGRLIDADYMIKQILSLPKDELSTEDTWAMKVLDLAPTIIEADKCCTYKKTGCGSCKRQLDCPIEADKEE